MAVIDKRLSASDPANRSMPTSGEQGLSKGMARSQTASPRLMPLAETAHSRQRLQGATRPPHRRLSGGSVEVGAGEVGSSHVRHGEVRSAEVCAAESCISQLRAVK
jgi:hypothetical protein